MKYDITYSCNHKGVVDLGGKEKDRDGMIRWYESKGLCPACYKIKKAQMDAEKMEKEREILAHFRPCELNGSPKQIEWAKKIRRKLLLETYEKGSDLGRLLIAYLCHIENDARFYIDTRNCLNFSDVLLKHGDIVKENDTIQINQEIIEIAESMRDEIYVE